MLIKRKPPTGAQQVLVTGHLGDMLKRRLGIAPPAPPAPPAKGKRVKQGSVIPLPKGAEDILSSILRSARNAVRKPRLGHNIHVSDLISKCVRKKVIVETHKVTMPVTRLSLMDALTFKVGDTIHDVIKERAVAGGPSLVWGKWRCACGSVHVKEPCTYAEVDQSVICDNCETGTDVYEEAEFIDPELHIVGHPDLILFMANLAAFYVTELKSISHDQFKELVRPKPEHLIQVLFYWYLMRRCGYDVVDSVSVLYVTKGYVFKGLPYKEFLFTPSKELKRLDPYLDDARAILRSRETGELPPRVTCVSAAAPEARSCEVCKICFGDTSAPAPVVVSFSEATGSSTKKASRRV